MFSLIIWWLLFFCDLGHLLRTRVGVEETEICEEWRKCDKIGFRECERMVT